MESTGIETLADLAQMDREWRVWRSVCGELEKLGIDTNQQKPLARALQRWGEEMAELRRGQDREVTIGALEEKRQRYPREVDG